MFIEQFLTRWINPSEATRDRSIYLRLSLQLLSLFLQTHRTETYPSGGYIYIYVDSGTIERGRERERDRILKRMHSQISNSRQLLIARADYAKRGATLGLFLPRGV